MPAAVNVFMRLLYKMFYTSVNKYFDLCVWLGDNGGMNIVEKAIERSGGTTVTLAKKLSKITGHNYKVSHIVYWREIERFPADVANVVASEIFAGEITAFEACPTIKRAVNA